MFGKIQKHPTINEAMEVTLPIKAVTYDVVTNPSHKSARIVQFIPESVEDFNAGDTLVTENSNYILTMENAHLPISSSNIVTDYIMMLINESFDEIKHLKF